MWLTRPQATDERKSKELSSKTWLKDFGIFCLISIMARKTGSQNHFGSLWLRPFPANSPPPTCRCWSLPGGRGTEAFHGAPRGAGDAFAGGAVHRFDFGERKVVLFHCLIYFYIFLYYIITFFFVCFLHGFCV